MKIAVVGAGAAGVFCAANLSEKFEVEIFEAQNKPLKKLLLTGGEHEFLTAFFTY